MYLPYILMAVLTAGVVITLLYDLDDRRLSAVLTGIIPAMALLLYLMLGRPDLPSHPVAAAEGLQPRHVMLLVQRPAQALLRNPEDTGAMAAIAELSARLGKYAEAEKLYADAYKIAKKNDDPRQGIYKKKAEDLAAKTR